jgi:hypothetical protein
MASTPILPYAVWASGTNQNSIPANDNSRRNQILNGLVISRGVVTAQPASPAEGAIYILGATHTGAQWASFFPDDIVIFSGGTWYAFDPVDGVVVNFEGYQEQYTGSAGWVTFSGGGGGGMTNPMTTAADIIVGGVSGTPARLAKGTAFQGLRVNSGATALEWSNHIVAIPIACSDETTNLTAGVAKVTFRMPFAFTLTAVRASVTTAATGGTLLTVDINESGSTILSTKITIDASEKTSTTAATPPVISDANLADDAEITIDIDSIGSTLPGQGLKVYLIGYVAS